jgi:murein DD-endopeptidase MepM/ murein hydrolase activator NlpD
VNRFSIIVIVFSLSIGGCAGLPVEDPYGHTPEIVVPDVFIIAPDESDSAIEVEGVYHTVQKGHTLWRIAKIYGVSIDQILTHNEISNAAQLEKGQQLLIPGAQQVESIVVESKEEKDDFVWPIEGKIISFFRDRKGTSTNKGIDIKINEGASIGAARTGRVVFADELLGYGQTVILDHEDGLYSVYSNNAELVVKLNDLVFKNKIIAYGGTVRDLAYLHFEIRRKSIEDNPLYYLPKR